MENAEDDPEDDRRGSRGRILLHKWLSRILGRDVSGKAHVYNIHNKNDTFTVEGVNAGLRHNIPTRARKSRCFSRKLENLWAILAVFVQAYNRYGLEKDRYRSRYPGISVPFSIFDLL